MAKSKDKKSKKGKKGKAPSKPLLAEIMDEIGGEGGAQLLGSEGLAIKIRGVISTQCPSIDWAIGRGGIPLGRLSVISGKEGSGKTTLALHIVAECQRQGGVAVYMDKEYKLDPDYARSIGVDTDKLVIIQPSYLESVFGTYDRVIQKAAAHREATGKRTPILLVLDSMNAAITKAEFEGEWDDKHMAPQARVYSQLLPRLIPDVSREDIALLWISQVRQKLNVQYGDPDDICGGKAPKFYASLILKVTRIGSGKKDGERISNKLRVEAVKNQIAPPFKRAEAEVMYGVGIDRERSLIWIAEKLGIVEQSGAYFKHEGHNIGQGMEASAEELREDDVWRDKILAEVREQLGW